MRMYTGVNIRGTRAVRWALGDGTSNGGHADTYYQLLSSSLQAGRPHERQPRAMGRQTLESARMFGGAQWI